MSESMSHKAGLHKVPHSDYTAELLPGEIRLSAKDYAKFIDACENPEPPNEKLIKAFNIRLKRITEKHGEAIGRLSDD